MLQLHNCYDPSLPPINKTPSSKHRAVEERVGVKIGFALDILIILGTIILGALGMAQVINLMPINASYIMVGSGTGALVIGCSFLLFTFWRSKIM